MTDILDEILAATESVRSQQNHHHIIAPPQPQPQSQPQPQPQPPYNIAPPPSFAPSPRGVQDDLAAFNLLQYPKKPMQPVVSTSSPTTQPQQVAAAAAAAAAAVVATVHSHTPTQSSSSSQLYTDATYQSATTPTWGSTSASAKRSYHAMEQPQPRTLLDYPGAPLRPVQTTTEQSPSSPSPPKKPKSELSTVVMPPSAKSILERREKAIREGRRKDAKLTESERRILRRLRNRESAERCRLRRVQQAVQLERKIESMQVENDRLVAVADEYEKTIQRLERVIKTFTESAKSAQSQQQQQ